MMEEGTCENKKNLFQKQRLNHPNGWFNCWLLRVGETQAEQFDFIIKIIIHLKYTRVKVWLNLLKLMHWKFLQ